MPFAYQGVLTFESNMGAPILGIQWHPEGYNGDGAPVHKNLLNYMRLAGDAYAAKRNMLKELSGGV